MKKQIGKINIPGYMKIVYTHVHGYDRSAPGRKNDCAKDARYKKNIFSFEQKGRDYKIIDNIIICRYKNQITEFDSHCLCNTYRIWPENDHPKTVYGGPKENMREKGSDWQIAFFMQK